ncbi:hypothetical protein DAEQUDRAFT_815284 [Daedalea quercina L-15889]|uniref:separase n=1 Tax=Daedalea quercina L-15889 TaxID=1314783 RepID=A0A165L693_9APHY|nr:hypothetical protein DAEQUDRAFT_815284 [Daedalea quercina L-15889]
MPATSRTRLATSSRPIRSTARTKTNTITPDDLANEVAKKLTIKDSRTTKGKSKIAPSPLTVEERRANAMRTVNTISKTLSELIASGSVKKSQGVIEEMINSARHALRELRELNPGDVDIERAASSVAGKLVSLERDNGAVHILTDMQSALTSLYAPNGKPAPSQLVALSLPPQDVQIPEVILILIATFFLHAMTVLSRRTDDLPSMLAILHDPSVPSLFDWAPSLNALPPKHHDALFTRTYTAIAKAASLPGVAMQHAFALRMYALECLARTRPSVVVPGTFWDQAVKWARFHAAEPITGDQSRIQDILQSIDHLVFSTRQREDYASFLECPGFLKFCEVWVLWAQQLGDIAAIDRIMQLRQHKGTRAASSTPSSVPSTVFQPTIRALDTTSVCMTLAQATAVFERWAECLPQDRAARFDAAVAAVTSSHSLLSADADEDALHGRDKVRRALERLRRTVIKVLEPTAQENAADASLPEDARDRARQILQLIGKVLMDTLRKHIENDSTTVIESDLATPALETLLVLARTTLIIRNPDTYSAAWNVLQEAKVLLFQHVVGCGSRSASATVETILEVVHHPHEKSTHDRVGWTAETTATLANYTRCVAGAFHNVAGTLCQADRISHAVRFLNEGCALGKLALEMHRAASEGAGEEDEEDGRDREGWKQLQEQLWHRWEILGVCQAKTGDRKLAFDAFIEAIKVIPLDLSSIHESLQTSTASAVFEASPPLHQLGKILDRVTYMGTCDLFLGHDLISAKSWYSVTVSSAPNHAQRSAFIGALLERQIAGLEGSRWKKGIDLIVQQLLRHALGVYEAAAFPVRRARIYLQLLERSYYATDESDGGRILGMSAEDVGVQVRALLSCEEPGCDAGFTAIRTGLLATLHLWLALHAHRYMGTDTAFTTIARHANDACKILKSMVQQAPRMSVTQPSAKELQVQTKKPAKKALAPTKLRTGIPRAAKTKRAQMTELPVTPKPRRALNDISLNATGLVQQRIPLAKSSLFMSLFDDLPATVNIIQMVAQLSGMLGHIFVKVQLLSLARRLSDQSAGDTSREYLMTSIELAYEYSQLGRASKALSIYSHALQSAGKEFDLELRAVLYLRYSESLAAAGQVLQSASVYCEAMALVDALSSAEEKATTTAEKVLTRVNTLERAALAARAFAMIQHARDDPATSLDGLLQSLRLWNRALETISRLRPSQPRQSQPESDNPFEVKKDDSKPSDPSRPKPLDEKAMADQLASQRAFQRRQFMDGTEWRLAEGLLATIFALVRAYYTRGSPREADYFIQQASALANSLNAPAMVGRALARQGEISLRLGHLEEGCKFLVEAAKLMSNVCGPDAADIHRLQGDYSLMRADGQTAQQLYTEATAMLDELGKMFAELDTHAIRKSLNSTRGASAPEHQGAEGALAPSMLAAVLRQHITLLRDAGEDYDILLKRFSTLPPTSETKAEESVLTAKLTLDEVFSQFRADMFLSSLAESAIMIPMGISSERVFGASGIMREILNTLSAAERSLRSDLGLIAHRGNVSSVRDTAISLALISALQSSLGNGSTDVSHLVARLIDMSTSITLRREMLEAIKHKFVDRVTVDDLQAPRITLNGTPIPHVEPPKPPRRGLFLDPEDEPETITLGDVTPLKAYWQSVASRYQSSIFDESGQSTADRPPLPKNWSVINISVTEDKSMLFVSRQRTDLEPLVFCLPLRGRREDEEDVRLTFGDAIDELKEIMRLNDEGTRGASNVKKNDQAARAAWWAARGALDRRLQDLLSNIEFCWFGAFKTVLSAPVQTLAEDMCALRARIDALFASSLVTHSRDRKTHQHERVQLDDALLECFAALPPNCRDEELEDLVYFVLDLYQFHGVPVAMAEVDVDQVVVDLRGALEEHKARTEGKTASARDHHAFLVLDKNVQGIPWESLPVLRGQSISRIPNMDFLIDRLELARQRRGSRADERVVDSIDIDPKNAYYVLNPSGDLKNTQDRFADWAKGMRTVGWDGIVGKVPSEQQLVDALTRNDLVVYFGHGGAEQYIRSTKIRHLPRCAATMLWGCSSGTLRDMGDFDRTGTPYNYMLAGCPTLIANLWDVTDRDIDKFSQAVFDELQLTPEGVARPRADAKSVVTAVAQARDCCKLKYLTGAAPVVYGIPFYL